MPGTPRKSALIDLLTRLAQEDIGPEATALDWACEQIASGITITALAKNLGPLFGENWRGEGSGPWTPSRAMLGNTLHSLPDADRRILEARKQGASALAEQALAIVDGASTASTAHVQKARLQSDARLQLAAAFDRDIFGSRPAEVRLDLGDLHIAALLNTKNVAQPRPRQLEPLPVEVLPASDTSDAPLALTAGAED